MRICCVLALLAVGCAAQEDTHNISGRVADAAGFVVPNVIVTLSGPVTLEVRSDVQGKFVFSSLEAGVYKLKFHMTGFQDRSLDVTMDQHGVLLGEVVLKIFQGDQLGVFEPPTLLAASGEGSIYGVVRYHSKGVGKAVVSLQLSGESSRVKITRTDARGNFELDDVKAGLYDLTIEADGFKSANVDSIGVQRGRVISLPPIDMLRRTTPIR